MAHALSIQTKEFPWEIDVCEVERIRVNEQGSKMFTVKLTEKINYEDVGTDRLATTQFSLNFCRHVIISGKSDLFDGNIVIGGETVTFVDMYVIGDEMVVIVLFDRTRHLLLQYTLQLVCPNVLPTTVPPAIRSIRRERGQIFAVAIRRLTLDRVNGSVSVGHGIVAKGVLFVCGQHWYSVDGRQICTLNCHFIAANPLLIDKYPDMDMSHQVAQLSHTAEGKGLWLHPWGQMVTTGRIYFLLVTNPTASSPGGRMMTDRLGVVLLGENGRKSTNIIKVDDGAIVNVLCDIQRTFHAVVSKRLPTREMWPTSSSKLPMRTKFLIGVGGCLREWRDAFNGVTVSLTVGAIGQDDLLVKRHIRLPLISCLQLSLP